MGIVSLKVGMVKQKFLPLFVHRIIRTPLFKILDPPLTWSLLQLHHVEHVGVNTITCNVEDNSILHKLKIPIVSYIILVCVGYYWNMPSLCRMLLKCRQLLDSYMLECCACTMHHLTLGAVYIFHGLMGSVITIHWQPHA